MRPSLQLDLALVADHGCGLLDEQLVLTLALLDRLLDLDLGIGDVLELPAEQRDAYFHDLRNNRIMTFLLLVSIGTRARRLSAPASLSPERRASNWVLSSSMRHPAPQRVG